MVGGSLLPPHRTERAVCLRAVESRLQAILESLNGSYRNPNIQWKSDPSQVNICDNHVNIGSCGVGVGNGGGVGV